MILISKGLSLIKVKNQLYFCQRAHGDAEPGEKRKAKAMHVHVW